MSRTPRRWAAAGAILAAAGVGVGALGAHALSPVLGPDALATWETAARYLVFHAIGLVLVGLAATCWPSRWLNAAGALFLAGLVLFCGSLAILALGGPRWMGAVAPFGGASFIAGWACLAVGALRARP